MMRNCSMWVLLVMIVCERPASAGVFEWLDAHPKIKEYGGKFAVELGGNYFKSEIKESDSPAERALKESKNAFITTAQDGLKGKLSNLEQVSDPRAAAAIRRINRAVDGNTTPPEFNAMVERTNAAMAKFEADISTLKYQQSELERDADRNDENIRTLGMILRSQDREFKRAMDRLDLSIAEIRGRLQNLDGRLIEERDKRKAGDANLQTQIDTNDSRLSNLERLISPTSRKKVAANIGATGALAILYDKDTTEAIRSLQLSMAYDKISEPHLDPGVRYWLAIAYRRAGKNLRADEMLAEAIAAERYRELPKWSRIVLERFQGPERFWMESRRQDPRFGVRAPTPILSEK